MNRLIFVLLFTLFASASFAGSKSVLKLSDGTKISNLSDWEQRRNEIRFELQDKIYGFLPLGLTPTFQVFPDVRLESINAYYREIKIRFSELDEKKYIRLGLFLPKDIKAPLPVFLSLNKCGNHTIVTDEVITIDKEIPHHVLHCRDKNSKRGSLNKSYPVGKILAAGYAFATFDKSEMDSDDAVQELDGIKGLIETHHNPNKSWGSLAAWAFGLIKSVDYLETDRDIDSSKIIVTGHSRRGKASLLAAAMDDRIAMVIPHQSGTGGTSRLKAGLFSVRERAQFMTHGSILYPKIGEPHQLTHFFSKEFENWSKRLSDLPIRASDIIALVAPRFIMDSQGQKDFWAGPQSARDMLKRAAPAWSLYNVVGIKNKVRIKSEKSRLTNENTGAVIQYTMKTKHVANEAYWDNFIEFANLKLKSKQPSSLLKE